MKIFRYPNKNDTYDGFMEKYPILFRDMYRPGRETCLAFGIECSNEPAWKPILERLCNELEYMNLTDGKKFGFEIRASQIKEKFGSLRFYYRIESCFSWKDLISEKLRDISYFFERKRKKNPKYRNDIKIIDQSKENITKLTNNGKHVFSKYENGNLVWYTDNDESIFINNFSYKMSKFFFGMSKYFYSKPLSIDNVIYDTISYRIDDLISECSLKTEEICRICGKKLTSENRSPIGHWIKFECKECSNKQINS